jgi:hypothetical protein
MSVQEEVPTGEYDSFYRWLQTDEARFERKGRTPLEAYLQSNAHQKALEMLRFRPQSVNVAESKRNRKLNDFIK